jgi:hypothetical protein
MTAASMKQIAAISSGIPNVYLENGDIGSIVSQDLRLAYADGLDFHTNAQIVASSGTQTLSTDPLLSVIRRSISLLWSNGYNLDTLLLTPANSESLDLLTSGGTAGWPGAYVFGAGQFGPPQIFGLQVRVSKNLANPVVADSAAYGRLYAGPVSLQRFEENAGASNSSLVRFEGTPCSTSSGRPRPSGSHKGTGGLGCRAGSPRNGVPLPLFSFGPPSWITYSLRVASKREGKRAELSAGAAPLSTLNALSQDKSPEPRRQGPAETHFSCKGRARQWAVRPI